MTASTGWTVQGTDLRTLAFNIRTSTGWDSWPGKRASQTPAIPYRHGIHIPDRLWYNHREVSLSMIVLSTAASGAVTHAEGRHGHVRQNLDTLFGLFHSQSPLSLITTVPEVGGGTLQRKLLVHVIDAFDVAAGPGFLRLFVVRMRSAWPFWRETSQNLKNGITGTTTFATGGNAPVADALITFNYGVGAVNPRLTHDDTGDYMEITGAIPTGGVEVDVGARTVIKKSDGSNYDSYLVVSSPWWFEFAPASTVNVTASGTTPNIDVEWYDQWL